MPEDIDFGFISDLEGGCRTTGYVPAVSSSKSGVTVATGFDLGQRKERDLLALGLDTLLIAKLTPYLGAKGGEAQALLDEAGLIITEGQAQTIDRAVKAQHISRLKLRYDRYRENNDGFENLPSAAQTVIASVAFQYGVLSVRTPKFWEAVTAQNWPEAIRILKAFGDAYPTRRRKEAALLEEILGAQAMDLADQMRAG